jgi:Rrf2 family iron-sulfur cluster assembly transcriptional regulator
MILGTKARYAVMAMVELAGREAGRPVALSELADSQEITVPYLEQIFAKLKSAGLVKSVRGPGGGYVLGKDAQLVDVAEIIRATEESLKMTRCDAASHEGCRATKTRCLTHDLWEGLERQIESYLSGITLADVRQKKGFGIQDSGFRVGSRQGAKDFLPESRILNPES